MTRRSNGLSLLKKIVAAGMAAMLLLSLTACGGGSENEAPEASASPSASPTATPAPTKLVLVATVKQIDDFLNIRSAASTDSEILGQAHSGDEFEVLTENCAEGWHEISYNGQKAYVYAEFVTVAEKEITEQQETEFSEDSETSADPDAPIIVNGSGREEVSSESSEDGMTTDSIKDTEDPERR